MEGQELIEQDTIKVQQRKLSNESAKQIFEEILEYYDINFDDIVSERGQNGAEQIQRKLIRAIKKGQIQTNFSKDIKEGFQIVQQTSRGVVVAYNEYNPTANIETDKARGVAESYYRLLGSLSGKGYDYIINPNNFSPKDWKIAECVAVLLLML